MTITHNKQFETVYDEELENRIKWERKQKSKRRLMGDDTSDSDDVDDKLSADRRDGGQRGKRSKRHGRSKRRQLVYDEMSGQVVVKRRRKRQSSDFDEWQDE